MWASDPSSRVTNEDGSGTMSWISFLKAVSSLSFLSVRMADPEAGAQDTRIGVLPTTMVVVVVGASANDGDHDDEDGPCHWWWWWRW